ncbi:MAG TPA: hypothetical protein VHZ74_06090 [Bryobacteraceae bacterium]|jgi:hypothetical protein|nr:hypothetical protein [Bryobacteraceae bacterium]
MSSAPSTEADKLPLWRLVAAILVIAAMVGVLLSLAPVYFENYQLDRYLRSFVHGANGNTTTDQTVQAAILARARQLDLPVLPDDVQVSHPNGKLQVQIKYGVEMNFPLYQVDLHFHPTAASR